MANKSAKFKVGLFVTIGLTLFTGLIIWMGASKYFRQAEVYVTYFNESVQGLSVDSLVKYRGVTIGRVKSIGVAPDYKLIEVIMEITFQGDLKREVTAQLKTVGITGLVFIGLDRIKGDMADLAPKISFASEYPIIPSKPSEIQHIMSVVNEVMSALKTVDFKAMAVDFKEALSGVQTFFKSARINKTMDNLAAAAASLEKASAQVSRILSSGEVDKTVAEAQEAMRTLRKQLQALQMKKISAEAQRLVSGVQRRAQTAVDNLAATSDTLRRAADTMERLMQRLEANPSQIIFSRPPAARGR